MAHRRAEAAAEENKQITLHSHSSYWRVSASVGVISHQRRLSGDPIPIGMIRK